MVSVAPLVVKRAATVANRHAGVARRPAESMRVAANHLVVAVNRVAAMSLVLRVALIRLPLFMALSRHWGRVCSVVTVAAIPAAEPYMLMNGPVAPRIAAIRATVADITLVMAAVAAVAAIADVVRLLHDADAASLRFGDSSLLVPVVVAVVTVAADAALELAARADVVADATAAER